MLKLAARTGIALAAVSLSAALCCPGAGAQTGAWMTYAGNPQHTALSAAPAQSLQQILWSTPVDLNRQYNGSQLLIHYGSPLITQNNTVVVTVKINADRDYKVEGRYGGDGTLIWSYQTDYVFPNPHNWKPSVGPTLTPDNRVAIPGAGGTVYLRSDADAPNADITQVAFYGIDKYRANKGVYDNTVRICTPITSDSQGNLYFGIRVEGTPPDGLRAGIVRLGADGSAKYVTAAAATGDNTDSRPAMNCPPALSNEEDTLYISVVGGAAPWLVALDPTTLATLSKVRLRDPRNPNVDATATSDSTSAPMVGPDGDVYFGMLEADLCSNHCRGWMLHYDKTLSTLKIPGAFGWDDTASVVPASAVPSYTGSSTYLICTKYNNYAGTGGNGVNKVGILDPNAPMRDPVTGATVMQEVITLNGLTPDPDFIGNFPDAVREWCINTAAIDPFTGCALVNSEDGVLYRWDFTANAATEAVTLTPGIGEAYTPTVVGPDGVVYAINNGILFAVGAPR